MSDNVEVYEGAGRNNVGHFVKGNSVAKGNPQAKRMAELRKAAREAATEEDVQALIRKMGEMGRDGDVPAAKVYLEYTVGKPVQGIELSGADGDPMRLDMANLTTVIMQALNPHPEARYAVAAALRTISLTDGAKTDGD
jgi:hypothetical protein